MKRRRFLRLVLWGAPVIAASLVAMKPAVFLSSHAADRLNSLIRRPQDRLRDHFPYLRLDPAGIEDYFADCQRFGEELFRHAPLSAEVCTRYLLSTDFFRNGADESRLVRYVGFYNPDVTPCNNPFATFDDA